MALNILQSGVYTLSCIGDTNCTLSDINSGVSLSFAVGGELKKVGVGSGATPKASRHMGGGGGGSGKFFPLGNFF